MFNVQCSMFNELFLISQYGVAVLACANAPSVNHIAYKDTTVADFTCVSYLQNNLYGWIEKNVAAHNGDGHALDYVGTVLYTTIDALLTALTNAVNVVVLKPVDVG